MGPHISLDTIRRIGTMTPIDTKTSINIKTPGWLPISLQIWRPSIVKSIASDVAGPKLDTPMRSIAGLD